MMCQLLPVKRTRLYYYKILKNENRNTTFMSDCNDDGLLCLFNLVHLSGKYGLIKQ
jgi:hypothetical protein